MQIWSSGGLKRAETGEVVQLAAVSENKATTFQDSFHYQVEYPRISQAHVEVGGDALCRFPSVPMYPEFLLYC